MHPSDFTKIVNKYKKCPGCGASYKEPDKLKVELENEIIHISCSCGFSKRVNFQNKEV